MHKEDKERVVAELTEKLKNSDTMIVADYRGLTMPQIDALRSKLIENGARFTVVKNTLTRRAAEAAGADALLALLEGPSAIAFVEADGDAVAVAKALADSARDTKVLEIRGGVMQGRVISGADVDSLAKLPPLELLRGRRIGGRRRQRLRTRGAHRLRLGRDRDARLERVPVAADQLGDRSADSLDGGPPEADRGRRVPEPDDARLVHEDHAVVDVFERLCRMRALLGGGEEARVVERE